MEFKVKAASSSQYRELITTEGNTRIESGLLDKAERKALADAMREAADELVENDD